ncbi:MAG TPA: glycerol-3-phosphate 1-O-acyltransferase PlsY [Phycisphaerales bacterium]|nr:glycerol-3-phosphate 1-O-acyltransferase PlsY [Phycisphaerales bacterium]
MPFDVSIAAVTTAPALPPAWTATETAYWAGLVLGAYLLGSIPFGLLIGLAKGVDVRQHGSKNIGTANVGRTLGRKWGVLTFFLDALKGFLPVLVAGFVLKTIARPEVPSHLAWAWLVVGVCAVVGHMWSPFLKFKGGKGVATGFGAMLAVFPILSLPAMAAFLVWLACVKTTRFIGLSSCVAAASIPFLLIFVTPVCRYFGLFVPEPGAPVTWPLWPYVTVAVLLALMVVWRHRSNIARMLNGTEPRYGRKPPPAAAPAEPPAARP